MEVQNRLARRRVRLERDGVDVSLALLHRAGPRPPVVFLHGFGSTKGDYADVARLPSFAGRAEIEQSGHWPLYSSPVATWRAVARFVDGADAGGGRL